MRRAVILVTLWTLGGSDSFSPFLFFFFYLLVLQMATSTACQPLRCYRAYLHSAMQGRPRCYEKREEIDDYGEIPYRPGLPPAM